MPYVLQSGLEDKLHPREQDEAAPGVVHERGHLLTPPPARAAIAVVVLTVVALLTGGCVGSTGVPKATCPEVGEPAPGPPPALRVPPVAEGLTLAWSAQLAERPLIGQHLAAVGDVAVVASRCDVYGLDAETGSLRWQSRVGVVVTELVAQGDAAYALSPEAIVRIDGAGRHQVVVRGLDEPRQMAVADNAVFVLERTGDVVAFDLPSGDRRWRRPGGGSLPPWPNLSAGAGSVLVELEQLHVLDAATGKERWSAPVSVSNAPLPTAASVGGAAGAAVAMCDDLGVVVLEASTGTRRGRAPLTFECLTIGAGGAGDVLAAGRSRSARVDAAGAVQWEAALAWDPIGAGTVLGDRVLFLATGFDAKVEAVEASTGRAAGRLTIEQSFTRSRTPPPVAVGRTLVFLHESGAVYAAR